MTTYREGLLSAARVCRERAQSHARSRTPLARHNQLRELEAVECELAIRALAEQQTLETRQAEDTFGRLVEYTHTERPTDQPAEPKCAAEHGYCAPCGGSQPMGGGCWKNDQRGAAALAETGGNSELGVRQPTGISERLVQSAPLPDPAGQASPSVAAAESPQGAAAPALPGPETVSVPREPTEAMIDAPRRIILYAETRGRTLQGLREHLDLAGVEFRSWFPEWAISEHGHLTKAAIAILIYRAMLAAGSAKC